MPSPTLRQRFNALRKIMAWSWKDIDRITGRRDTGSNISKGVPNWARLAIVANERYQHLLRLHILDAVRRELGYEWALRQRAPAEFSFTPPYPVGDHLTLSFTYGQLRVTSNSAQLLAVVALLNELYPTQATEKPRPGTTAVIFKMAATATPAEQLAEYLAEHGVPE